MLTPPPAPSRCGALAGCVVWAVVVVVGWLIGRRFRRRRRVPTPEPSAA